jgi:hypothetical protein
MPAFVGRQKSHGHKPGTKLEGRMKHNDKILLKPASAQYKPSDLLAGKPNNKDRTLVSFQVGFTTYFAKLHLLQMEEKGFDGNWHLRGQFPLGQQIEPPALSGADKYEFTPLPPPTVSVIDDHVAELMIGDVTYQVVTFDALQ